MTAAPRAAKTKAHTVAEMPPDQAEGLRRLLAHGAVRVVTLCSGRDGVGKTSTVINLAVALARRGKYVMVIDEHAGKNNVSARLGLEVRWDLMDVIRRQKSLQEVILHGPEGIAIVPAALGVQALAELDPAGQQWLVQSFSQLPQPVDVALVDAISGSGYNALSLGLAAHEVVVVVSNQPASITDAYALIKILSQDYARQRFRILVNKVDSEQEACAIYNNMVQAAKRFLHISLDFMGYIPKDEKLRQSARIHRAVVEAFPTADSAQVFRQFADELELWPYPNDDNGRLDSFVQRLIQNSRMTAEGLRY